MHRNDFDAALVPDFRSATAPVYRELLRNQQSDDRARLREGGGARRTACPVCAAAVSADLVMRKAGLEIVRCGPCGMVYSALVLEHGADRAFYGESAFQTAYFDLKRNAAYAALEERKARYILERLQRWQQPGPLLEIGSGAGRLLDAARTTGWSALGIEANAAFAEESRRRHLDVLHGWFPECLPQGRGPFSSIVMLDVLEHAIGPVALLASAKCVLRRNGVIAVQVPNVRSLLVQLQGEESNVFCHSHWNYFDPATLAHCAERAGLRCVESETIISEIDRIHAFPMPRIAQVLGALGIQPPRGELDVDWLHGEQLGYKILAFLQAA